MNKKIIVISIVLSLVFLGCESAIAIQIEKESNEINEDYNTIDQTYDVDQMGFAYVFQANGAVHKITNINFIDGSTSEISKLNKLFSKKLFFPVFSTVFVSNLTFTIAFDEPVESRLAYRYWYGTSIGEINNIENITNTINTPHSCTVYNFSGLIKFDRPRIHKFLCIGPKFFRPYRYYIIGYCEDAELTI